MTRSKASDRAELAAPPYISYRTFSGFLDRLSKRIPSRIDRSVMSSLSGSNQSQLMAALRYLELISGTGQPTERLSKLLDSSSETSQAAMRDLLVSSYPFLFKTFDLKKATFDELSERFVSAGASGDTVRKCIAFFLAAAKYAGLQISPFVTSRRRLRVRVGPRKPSEAATTGRPQGAIRSNEAKTWREMALLKFPEFDPSWPIEIKTQWFDAFCRLMKWMESEPSN
jgi:hypothetical protein